METNVFTLPVSLEQVAALIKTDAPRRPAATTGNGTGVGC